jgi:hypothetical protein
MLRQSGLTVYSPSPFILETTVLPMPTENSPKVPLAAAKREAVISRSRERYTKPRAEVEAQIAVQMGWDNPVADETPDAKRLRELKAKLQLCGVNRLKSEQLVTLYPLERIEHQIDWLPYRHAKTPSRYLIAAIEHNYGIPTALHKQQGVTHPLNASGVQGDSVGPDQV